MSRPPGSDRRRARPPAVVVVASAVALEVLALLAVVAIYAVGLSRGAAVDGIGAAATAALAAALAVGLSLCVRGLLLGRRWSRAPLLTWQLFQVVVSAPLVTGPLVGVAVVFVALALVTGVCLASRPVAEHVEDDGAPPPVL